MKLLNIARNLSNVFKSTFRSVGELINQNPSNEDLRKVKKTPAARKYTPKKVAAPAKQKSKVSRPKRARLPKGKPNTETKIFNHPRH